MRAFREHAIHAVIVMAVLWGGSTLLPQFYHFANLGAVALGTFAYMGAYFLFNLAFTAFTSKIDFDVTGAAFLLFMFINTVPGIIILYLLSLIYSGFWACTPWLIAIILSVVIEVIHLIAVLIQEK